MCNVHAPKGINIINSSIEMSLERLAHLLTSQNGILIATIKSVLDKAKAEAFPRSPLNLYHLGIICKTNSDLINKPKSNGNANK